MDGGLHRDRREAQSGRHGDRPGLWGRILRLVVTASLAIVTLVVPETSILVDKATPITTMQTEHPRRNA